MSCMLHTDRGVQPASRHYAMLLRARSVNGSYSTLQAQDIRIFVRGDKFVTVPTSPPASIFPGSCTCSKAGGFEGGSSTGLVGCTPCRDGYFSSSGMAACERCPLGTYASQHKGLRDFYKCPNATSPAIRFSAAYQWKEPVVQAEPSCMQLVAGADVCTACPADRPHTHDTGSTSPEDCRRCAKGSYFDGTECRQCRPPCNRTMDEYEIQPCSHDRNRECGYCDSSSCDPVTEYVAEEGCTAAETPRACRTCTDKPEHSHFILGNSPCSWACDEGYYSDIFSGTCERCTAFDARSCPAGAAVLCAALVHRRVFVRAADCSVSLCAAQARSSACAPTFCTATRPVTKTATPSSTRSLQRTASGSSRRWTATTTSCHLLR